MSTPSEKVKLAEDELAAVKRCMNNKYIGGYAAVNATMDAIFKLAHALYSRVRELELERSLNTLRLQVWEPGSEPPEGWYWIQYKQGSEWQPLAVPSGVNYEGFWDHLKKSYLYPSMVRLYGPIQYPDGDVKL